MLSKFLFYPLFLFICCVIRNSEAYSEILKLNNESKVYCSPLVQSIRYKRPVTYFIPNNFSDNDLKDCLLTKNYGLSLTMLGHDHLLKIPIKHEIYYKLDHTDIYPDLNIIVSDLDDNLFKERIHRFSTSPHYVFIFLIFTTKNISYACNEEGVFDKGIFNSIEELMNRLWHQYEMFHFVLEFPYVCPGYSIILHGKKPSGVRVFDRTIMTTSAESPSKVLEFLLKARKELPVGYPIRANIFKRFPTAISDCSKMGHYIKLEDERLLNGLCGMDPLIMHDILNYFKFDVSFPDVDNTEGYGYFNKSIGCATGSLAYLLDDIIDISFNSRFLVKYLSTDDLIFIHYVSSDAVCAVMREPLEIPLWHYAFNLFRPMIWAAVILTFALAGIFAKALSAIRKKIMQEDPDSTKIISYVIVGFFGCNGDKKVPVSILGGTCLFMSITMLALYQGNVNYMYTTLLKYNKMKTLAELAEAQTPIYTSQSMLGVLGTNATNASHFVFKSLDKKTLISNGNLAFIHRKADMLLEISINYKDEKGRPLLYIVNECYANFYLSYIARSDFPFMSEVKIYIMRLIEAGLPDAYYRATKNFLRLGELPIKLVRRRSYPRDFFPGTLEEQRVAFCLLLVGSALSTVVFIFERWWARRSELSSSSVY